MSRKTSWSTKAAKGFDIYGCKIQNLNIGSVPTAYPAQNCKWASLWSPNPARARNHTPEPGPSPTFIFEARFRPENQTYRV